MKDGHRDARNAVGQRCEPMIERLLTTHRCYNFCLYPQFLFATSHFFVALITNNR